MIQMGPSVKKEILMAANKIPIATDSAEELRGLIGDDATATFESDPKFVESNPTESASSENIALRDTDDTEDSEEEDEEEEDEDEDELEEDDEEDEDVDEDEEEEDDEDEDVDDDEEEDDDDADEVLRTAEPVDVHGPGKRSKADIEKELEEMQEETEEEDGTESPKDAEADDEGLQAERAIDEALRLSAISIAGQGY
jgi:HIV Tat-specific factor 1